LWLHCDLVVNATARVAAIVTQNCCKTFSNLLIKLFYFKKETTADWKSPCNYATTIKLWKENNISITTLEQVQYSIKILKYHGLVNRSQQVSFQKKTEIKGGIPISALE
jgi:hypothetical protein